MSEETQGDFLARKKKETTSYEEGMKRQTREEKKESVEALVG